MSGSAFWINGAGELQTFKFERAILRSHARLTYEQVQQVRDGEKVALPNGLSPRVIDALFGAYDVSVGSEIPAPLELETSEPLVTLMKPVQSRRWERGHLWRATSSSRNL